MEFCACGSSAGVSSGVEGNRSTGSMPELPSDWRGWTAPNKDTLYMKVRGRDVYRVDLSWGSNQLTWPGTHLVSIVRGADSVCHPLDLDLRVSDGFGMAIPIRAKAITKLTPDEIKDVQALPLWLDVNGERMQSGSTATMIFPVAFLISYISQFLVLDPGDVITTGTPAGVGMARTPPHFLKAGDEVRLGVEGLGEAAQGAGGPLGPQLGVASGLGGAALGPVGVGVEVAGHKLGLAAQHRLEQGQARAGPAIGGPGPGQVDIGQPAAGGRIGTGPCPAAPASQARRAASCVSSRSPALRRTSTAPQARAACCRRR